MAFEESNGNGMYMPVAPAYGGYGNNGFGGNGDWAWIIILLLCGWGGMGFGGMGGWGGFGNMALGYDFPWILNGQNNLSGQMSNGFQNAQLSDSVNGIRDAVTSGFGDVQTALCGGFANVNANISNGFAQAEIGENARQMANMQQMFGLQQSISNCCCENRLATANLEASLAREACASRATSTANTQAILDKLCQLEMDGYRREADQLRSELQYARGQASQVEQTARILAGQAAEIDGVYNRLKNCPVGTYTVGNPLTPVNNCGCGCGNF